MSPKATRAASNRARTCQSETPPEDSKGCTVSGQTTQLRRIKTRAKSSDCTNAPPTHAAQRIGAQVDATAPSPPEAKQPLSCTPKPAPRAYILDTRVQKLVQLPRHACWLHVVLLTAVLLVLLLVVHVVFTRKATQQCNPHLAGRVATALSQYLPPHWHQQLLLLQDDLDCDALVDAGAKAHAAAILCSSTQICTGIQNGVREQLAARGTCLWLHHFWQDGSVSPDMEVGWLQKQLVEFSLQCPQGGVVIMQGALSSAVGNLNTLIAALSEVGHLRHQGQAVQLQQHVFVLLEEVSSRGGDLLGLRQPHEMQLRRLLKEHLYRQHGVVPRSNQAAVVDAALRRLDHILSVE